MEISFPSKTSSSPPQAAPPLGQMRSVFWRDVSHLTGFIQSTTSKCSRPSGSYPTAKSSLRL